jgi:hypothetical protein
LVGLFLFKMTFSSPRMRLARHRAACALILTCTFAPAATARQQGASADSSTPSTAAKKPATKKPAAKSSTATHKASTNSSATHSGAAAKSAKTYTAATSKRASSKISSRKKNVRARGQQKIDSERAEQIQTALIREHYLTGEPTGTWSADSEDAMRRYQSDHGWQTKEVPDARALIKLGLGPSNDHLLNPESAMTTSADVPKAASLPTTSHGAPTNAYSPSPSSSTSSTVTPTPSTGTTSPASTPTQDNPQRQ